MTITDNTAINNYVYVFWGHLCAFELGIYVGVDKVTFLGFFFFFYKVRFR